MRFSKDFPDKLRSSILASEVIARKVQLKKKGKEFQGLCPFHNEKTPSFTVNDQKGFYHCFGCQAHGDIITFVMNNEGLEFKDAVVNLANDFGIQIPWVKENDDYKIDHSLEQFEILEKICMYFEKNLYENFASNARKYLQKRQLNSQIAKKFRLGYAVDSYEALSKYLLEQNYTENQILKTGIIAKNDRSKLYDKMRNRIIFPITNKKNQVIAFGGRTIGDDLPKYLNSAETDIFKKNQTLYNLANARKSIFDNGYVIIVEGYMDVISLVANGIENVVAGLGTAIGSDHLKQLFLMTDKIVFCLDGDNAGVKASRRLADIALPLITSKKNIGLAILPDNLDPDDFIKNHSTKAFKDFITNCTALSQSLFEFTLSDLNLKNSKQIIAEDRAKLSEILQQKTNLISDPNCRKHFNNFFKDSIYQLTRNIPKNQLSSQISSQNNHKYPNLKASDIKLKHGQNIALSIIAVIIAQPTLCNYKDDIFNLRQSNLFTEQFTSFKEFLIELIDNNENKLLETLETSEFSSYNQQLITMIASLAKNSFESCKNKLRILLLKDLLLQLEIQYQESLQKTDELQTHQSAITDQKVKEIFDYKNSIQALIIRLESDM